jgi:hypothetical protein
MREAALMTQRHLIGIFGFGAGVLASPRSCRKAEPGTSWERVVKNALAGKQFIVKTER